MMKRLLSWLFGLPTLIILLLFALANRHSVRISLDPLTPETPWLALDMPLWMVLFAGILLGMLTGGMAAWVKQSKWRRQARRCRHELKQEKEARQRAEEQLKALSSAPAVAPPAQQPVARKAISGAQQNEKIAALPGA